MPAAERVKLETEGLRLIRQIAEATREDPTEVLVRASTGNGRYPGGRKTRLDTMTVERLQLTVIDLREAWARVAPKGAALEADPEDVFYARHGRPEGLAARGADAVRARPEGKTDREALTDWLDSIEAPSGVRMNVGRLAWALLREPKVG